MIIVDRLCMSRGFPAKMMEQTIMTSLNEVTRISLSSVIEDMLRETRAGLSEAVVVGPGKAILFYGRRSLGEGLKV